jgi:hypothetical protein
MKACEGNNCTRRLQFNPQKNAASLGIRAAFAGTSDA